MKNIFRKKIKFKKQSIPVFVVLVVVSIALALSSIVIPKIMAGDTVVSDLHIQAQSEGTIISFHITDENELDTKVVVPLPDGVTYKLNQTSNIGVTEDTVNHQLVIDWVDGQSKDVNLQLEAKNSGVYDFVVQTVREGEPVNSPVSSIKVTLSNDESKISESSSIEKTEPTINEEEHSEEPAQNDQSKTSSNSENGLAKANNNAKEISNPVSIEVRRANNEDPITGVIGSPVPDDDLTHLYDNITGISTSGGPSSTLSLKVTNTSDTSEKGDWSIILPNGSRAIMNTGKADSLDLEPISSSNLHILSQGKPIEYNYDSTTCTLKFEGLELQAGEERIFTLSLGFYGVLGSKESSKVVDIPQTWTSSNSGEAYESKSTLTFYNFIHSSKNDIVVLGNNENNLFPNEKGVYELPYNQTNLSITGHYNPQGGIAGGTPKISSTKTSITAAPRQYITKGEWKYPEAAFDSINLTTNFTDSNQNLNGVLQAGKGKNNWLLENDTMTNYGQVLDSEGKEILPLYAYFTAQNIPSQMHMKTNPERWDYDKTYEVQFGYRIYSSSSQYGYVKKDDLKFVRKRPQPIVQQTMSSKNMIDDEENYIGDTFSYSVDIENNVSDSAMTKTTNTTYVPKELEVDQNSIEVLDSSGNKIKDATVKYTSAGSSNLISVTGNAVELSGKNKITVQYKVQAHSSGVFETRSQVVYSDSYGKPQETSQATNTVEVKNIDPLNNDFDLRPEDATKFDTTNSDYPALTTLTKNEKTPMIYKVKNTRAPRDETLTHFDLWLTDVNWKNNFTVDKSSFYIKKSTTSEWEKVAENKIDDTTFIGDKPSYTIKDLDLKLVKGETIEIKFSITAKSAITIKKNAIAAQGTIKESGSLSSLNSLVVKNGELRFENVPDIMSFEDSKISNRTVESSRKDKDWKITVEDTRLKKNNWRVTAQLADQFKDTSGSPVKENILLFRKANQEDQWIVPDTAVNVFDGTSTENDDLYDVSWKSNEGPLIQVAPGTVKVGRYTGIINWKLIDAPV
ncbi:hypothetical protein [Lactococcus garvieae]|uniref:hypothetical protein n=1 Tax=Lactococcus garvieae TaxID=1363 RepID=UPI00398E59E1